MSRWGEASEERSSGLRLYPTQGRWVVNIPGGLTGGTRKRKWFVTKEDAVAYAEEVEKGIRTMGSEFFAATREERIQFAKVLPQLREAGVTIEEVVTYALPRLTTEPSQTLLRDLIKKKDEEKTALEEAGKLRDRSLKDYRSRTSKIARDWGDVMLADLDQHGQRGSSIADGIVAWIEDQAKAASRGETQKASRSKLFGAWMELMRDAVKRGLIMENPLDRLTTDQRQMLYGSRGVSEEPPVVTPVVARRMLEACLDDRFRRLLAPVALGFFAGLRTQEIQRVDWKSIRLDERRVEIGHDVAKTGYIRNVDLCEAAVAWLSLVQQPAGPLYDSQYQSEYGKHFNRLVNATGNVYKPNGMRHTYASALYAITGDIAQVKRQLGHVENSTVLFRHYVQLMDKSQANKFFAIRPPEGASVEDQSRVACSG